MNSEKKKESLSLNLKVEMDRVVTVCHALGHEERLKIIQLLSNGGKTLTELKKITGLPATSLIFHLNALLFAKLIATKEMPSKKGKTKIYVSIFADIGSIETIDEKNHEDPYHISMPIWMYTNAETEDWFQLAFPSGAPRLKLLPRSLLDPRRKDAGLIWTPNGSLSYSFPAIPAKKKALKSVTISLEACSEFFGYRNDFKTDIYFYINGKEIGYHTANGDYGGIKGKLNPSFWPDNFTQYGDFIAIAIDSKGVFINGTKTSSLSLSSLNLDDEIPFSFSLGTKLNSAHRGGFNLFGSTFGNIPQEIELNAEYL